MAIEKKVSAIKNSPRHLLGIQSLSVQEAKKILSIVFILIFGVINK